MKPHAEVRRMHPVSVLTNPWQGTVRWSPVKSLWFFAHLLVAVAGGVWTFGEAPVLLSAVLTVFTLCLGHTVGLHRLLIHRSFECPRWLERVLVYLGTLVGMGGPFGMIYLHEIRDWAQRHDRCHPFFIHQTGLLRDAWWNLHCEIHLEHPPRLEIEPETARDPFYRLLQRTWMLQQLPLAALLHFLGGWPWVVWGVSVRIVTSLTGHWLVGHFAHSTGRRDWHLEGHAVQGFNLPRLGLLTMGECWHNNHHAFPNSARLGLRPGQHDPGWWFITTLRCLRLAWNVRLPENLPPRPERVPLPSLRPPRRLSSFFDLL
ncbi:MAG: acyl-CoA desaturase [Verrucomicrobiaceae bacterium]|nr:acyl-CoA desaturase [Verrucomicrobiaceae bacterium]